MFVGFVCRCVIKARRAEDAGFDPIRVMTHLTPFAQMYANEITATAVQKARKTQLMARTEADDI